ncbi:MAG: M20 family metallo-hydrolase [Pseudomonadota bacterium]
MTYPTVDQDRLWSRQLATDRIGATLAGGVHRMALTAEDIACHRLIADWALARDWTIDIDPIGNMFIRRAGSNADLPPVASGSHTDSQPMAGRFDGMSGVLAAFEALEAIDDAGIATAAPLEVAIWNNEEGPRFNPACMGSAVYGGVRDFEEILVQTDADGIALATCIAALRAAIPEAGDRALGAPMAAFLESHIEQGVELETSGAPLGIVEHMQGYRRWTVDVRGEDGHSGALPISRRRDAFVAATDIAVALRQAFADETDEMRFTIGRFDVRPGGITVIPGHVHFTIDMRHPRADILAQQGNRVEEICRTHVGVCDLEITEFATAPSITFDADLRARFAAAADRRGLRHQPINSRAGHDARNILNICPAAMVFIPCKDGISHNEAESAEPEHCAAAAQVIADVMVDLAGRA